VNNSDTHTCCKDFFLKINSFDSNLFILMAFKANQCKVRCFIVLYREGYEKRTERFSIYSL
ncbi:hypothetical protein, partial [Aliivibrio fischeri]